MDRITMYLLTAMLVSNPCDSGRPKSWFSNDLGRVYRSAGDLGSSNNEVPTKNRDSPVINQYSSPPLCYQVQYAEMADTPKILCGKELQEIYLKFNPALMKNLYVNIYLTNEDNPITIKPMESLNSIYNDSISTPYFEPPINPEIAQRFAALNPSSREAEEVPAPFKAIYYYPEAQKYPGIRDIHKKVTISTPTSEQFTYEKDDSIKFNRWAKPQSSIEYDPYAYRNGEEAGRDQSNDDSKDLQNLWNKLLTSNKPLVLNCLISPVSCPTNIYPLPLNYISSDKTGNSGISTNSYNSYNANPNNNVGFEDYDEEPNSLVQPLKATKIAPYYNYQDLQKMLLDAKRLQTLNSMQNSDSNLRNPSYFSRGKVFNNISPNAYYPNNLVSSSRQLVTQNRQYSEYPSYEYNRLQNSREPKYINYYPPASNSQRLVQPVTFQKSVDPMSNLIMPQGSYAGQFSNRLQFPVNQFAQPQFYPTNRGPLIRDYYKKPTLVPSLTPLQLTNDPKFLSNFHVLLGFIQPMEATLDGKPHQPDVNNNSPAASLSNDAKPEKINSKTTTDPDSLDEGDLTTVTESSTVAQAMTLGDTGPEVTSPPEIGNQEEDQVQKRPGAFDEDPESEIQQSSGREYFDNSAKSFKEDEEDELASDNILKDYILNLKNRERQYEKVILQSQRQLEELQNDLDQLKKGTGKYSKPSTPFYNYGVNNNNNIPLPPLVPIVQHFTSLNPLTPNSPSFYPQMSSYLSNGHKADPLHPFLSSFFKPTKKIPNEKPAFSSQFYDRQAEDTENDAINLDALNNFAAYFNPELAPRLVYFPYRVGDNAYRMPGSSDADNEFIDYESESDPRTNSGIANNNVYVRNKNINLASSARDDKIDDETGPKKTSKGEKTTESPSTTGTETTYTLPTQNTETTTDSTTDDVTTDSTIDDLLSTTLSNDPDENSPKNSGEDVRNADNSNGKKIKTTIKSKLKFVKEISSNRTIFRDNEDSDEVSTPVTDSSTALSTMPTDESTILTETTGTETETTLLESTPLPTVSTDDTVGRNAENPDIPVTTSTLNPLKTSTKNSSSPESQKQEKVSPRSAEPNSENPVSSLDPYIEDIVRGIKEKRNYMDEIFQNGINNNPQPRNINSDSNSSKNTDSNSNNSNKISPKVEKSKKSSSSILKDNKFGTLALVEAPLTIVYYPGYDKDRKSRHKS